MAKLIKAAEGLKATREFALSRAEQSFASEAKRIASILGPSAVYARSLSQELSHINRAMEQVASLSSSLNYNKMFQPPNFTEAIQSLTVAQGLAWGVPKQLFESQSALQQQVEACINTYETACGALLRDQHSLRDSISAIQMTLNSVGIAKEFFQDSYSKAVRVVLESYLPTQSFLADSISRVLERESSALRTAAQLAAQGLSKDLLANTQAIFDQRHFAFEADLIQKAIAPFVQQWGGLVCEAKLVSVDIKYIGN